jgi:hypothetical protein
MLGLFLIWRVFGLIIAFIADKIIPSSGDFRLVLKPIDLLFQFPSFLQDSGNFDGSNYLHIARYGYGLYQQAFFPLFPFLIHIFSFFTNHNYFIAGYIISNTSFLIGIFVFKKYLQGIGKNPKQILWIFLFLLTFPTSFFFGAVYTESVFFLFFCLALYFIQRKKYWLVGIFCILTALTRLMGVFLIIPFLFTVLIQQQKMGYANLKHFFLNHKKLFLIISSPIIGLLVYMLYLSFTVHNPFAFYSTQSSFLANRSTNALIFLPQVYYRYLNIFVHAQHNLVYFVAVLEFLIFNLVFIVLLYDLWTLWKRKNVEGRMSLIGLNLFSFINILLPTLTGTMLSIPRFALLSLSFFIRLAEINNMIIKVVILILFITFSAVLLVLFSQGYFIS